MSQTNVSRANDIRLDTSVKRLLTATPTGVVAKMFLAIRSVHFNRAVPTRTIGDQLGIMLKRVDIGRRKRSGLSSYGYIRIIGSLRLSPSHAIKRLRISIGMRSLQERAFRTTSKDGPADIVLAC